MTTKSRYKNSTQLRKTYSRSRACPGHTSCPGGVIAWGVDFLGYGLESRTRYPVSGSCPTAALASCERKWKARPPRMGEVMSFGALHAPVYPRAPQCALSPFCLEVPVQWTCRAMESQLEGTVLCPVDGRQACGAQDWD